MASRIFNLKQSLEREIKEVYAAIIAGTPASAVLDLTADITLTSRTQSAARNGDTVETVVNAAAANPTDTVLVSFTGTVDAVVITVTPNDGTNNGATPVDLTTANLVELINTGAVAGKTVTLTDASSLRADLSAAGGDATALANGGEGDGVEATFSGGIDASLGEGLGVRSVALNSQGEYSVVLDDAYSSLRSLRAVLQSSSATDLRVQIKSEAVANSSSKAIVIMCLAGTSPVNPPNGSKILMKLELKNTNFF